MQLGIMHQILSTLLLVLLGFAASYNGAQAQRNVSISFNTVFNFNATPLGLSGVDLNPSCVATGFSPYTSVTFEWRFNGTNINSSPAAVSGGSASASFMITMLSKKDAGVYTCVASGYGVGGVASAQISSFLSVAYLEVLLSAPNTFEVRAGQDVTLVCPTASFPPTVTYTWYRESTSGSVVFMGTTPAYDIVNASYSDAGVYVCRPSNGYVKSIDATTQVFMLAPPAIRRVNTTVVTVGNTLLLNCTVDSVHPPPSYSWKSGDQPIVNTSRTTVSVGGSGGGSGLLQVRQVVYSDGGVYTCVATNSIGQDTADFSVVVQGPPYVSVPGGGLVIAPEGSTPSLVCSWTAYPPPSILWSTTGGVSVSTGGRYSTPSVGTLVIGQVGGADEGMYLCSFSNALGSGNGSIQLVVIEIPTGLVVSSMGGHSLELRWNAITSRTHVDQYVLEYGVQGNLSYKNMTFPGNSTTGMVWGLSAGSTYFLRLKAVKLGMAGTPGNQIMATTTTTVPVLALVSINPLDDARSLQVRWHISDTGGVSILVVNVTVMLNGSVVQTVTVQPSWVEYWLVTGLMPTTSYTIEVSAGNAVGVSSVTSTITTPLAPPTTPTKPSIVSETSHSFSLNTLIDSVGSAPVQFILINVSELHSGQSHVINASINDTSVVQYSSDVTMTSLGISLLIEDTGGLVKPNIVYVFSVAAMNTVGASHFSEPTDPTSLVSPGYSSLYYIVAGVIGGVVALAILLAAAVLLYTRIANCSRGKRISINPYNNNSDSPLKFSGDYTSSQNAEKPKTTPSPINRSKDARQTPCDPHRGIPSPLDLPPEERARSRCDSRGGIPNPLNLTRGAGSHQDLQGAILGSHEIPHRGANNPSVPCRGLGSPTDLRFGVRSPHDFHAGVNNPADLNQNRGTPGESLIPYNQLKSPLGYTLNPLRSFAYALPPSSPVSEAESSPLDFSTTDFKHVADDVDTLSSPPTSLIQDPRPFSRKLLPTDKRSLSSDKSDGRSNGKISMFPGLDIDVPCGLPFSMRDSLFELDSIDIPKASYMTDV